jgi:uncharacterized protein DUF4149
VIGFLRFIGLMNAAVWFGAAVFFTFGIGAAPFSPEMKELLGAKTSPYFPGAIAQIYIARYFDLQLICGAVALLHLLAEWLYLGRTPQKFGVGLLTVLIAAGLLGDFWLQPKMKGLHRVKYGLNSSPAERENAARSFRAWHGASQGINLVILAGLAVYLWRVANPADPARFVSTAKFRS